MNPNFSAKLQDIYNYCDMKKEKYANLFSTHYRAEFIQSKNDSEKPTIKLIDKVSGKIVLTAKYQTIGVFVSNINLWIWAWSNPLLEKNQVYTAKSIFDYAFNSFKIHDENDDFTINLKSMLTTSRIILTNEFQRNFLIYFCQYITKSDYIIINNTNVGDNIEIYLISDITIH